ncbi:outer membrane beta-barrel protein [Paraflavitalea speifideaquila]|uniref:outer membrane beta-barrel protein n=1 Tax=Paraflavitalea speifideaquila TaxID=3076558 RepID=UPI0028E327F1|nr:outer membrane beta-barrel protein [Paraflavitalea speifideiaquila]
MGIGLKAGLNFSTVTGTTTSFKPGNQSGFMVAGFYAPSFRGFGYRTELVFSQQGFSFTTDGKTENVKQQYIFLPQLTTFTIARVVQLQAGAQIGFLLNARSTKKDAQGSNDVMSFYNRIEYGFAGGLEIYPFKGLLIGSRYNLSLGNVYKQTAYPLIYHPNAISFQYGPERKECCNAVFLGYRF